ncbi:MAG: hypothetical protein NTZ56_13880 [Acidobacteria bacterium]|nr:hypothetical protein [Acidobacteriota bacterium]
MINSQARAILATQWRMLINFYRRHGRVAFILSGIFSAVWYLGFAALAVFAAVFLADSSSLTLARKALGPILFLVFLYWQGMPLLMASMGGMLDLKKLRVYPIAEARLYRLEILLRSTLFLEMPIVMLGATIGLLLNPGLPKWCALAPVLYTVFNLTLGAGLRDLLMRALAHKKVREVGLIVVVLLAAAPSFLASRGGDKTREFGKQLALWTSGPWWPWKAAGSAALAEDGAGPWLWLIGFALIGWAFGRWQFNRSLYFDGDAERSKEKREVSSRYEWMTNWPSRIFPDPLGALVEKEIRFLSRITRFRVVFFMGFSFGLLIWLPLASGFGPGASSGGWMTQNFLSVVAVYALMLLSEVCFYNAFGFDRSATQMYYLVPVPPATILKAKNIAASFFVVAEISLVAAACTILRMPVTAQKLGEAACVCALFTLFLLGIGNLGSTRAPRAMNPNEGWKRSAGAKVAMFALLVYPLISMLVGLAYLSRYAFSREEAFYVVIGVGLFIATCFYKVALDSAVETMSRDREKILTLLAQTDTPVL